MPMLNSLPLEKLWQVSVERLIIHSPYGIGSHRRLFSKQKPSVRTCSGSLSHHTLMISCSPAEQRTLNSGKWHKLSRVLSFRVKSLNLVNLSSLISPVSRSFLMVR